MQDDPTFDRALVAAAFSLAAEDGWSRVTVPAAARHGGLKLDEARARFSGRRDILMRFGRIADMAALAGTGEIEQSTSERDRLFDIVMRRIDVLQTHRAGVLALARHLPTDPGLSLCLAKASARSMAWLLEAAGIRATGARGALRIKGMCAVWLWTVRAWSRDQSEELSGTMVALDQALTRAEQAEASLPKFCLPKFKRPWDPANSMREEDYAAAEPPPADEPDVAAPPDPPPPDPPPPDVPPPPALSAPLPEPTDPPMPPPPSPPFPPSPSI